jgi:hypothetical protein
MTADRQSAQALIRPGSIHDREDGSKGDREACSDASARATPGLGHSLKEESPMQEVTYNEIRRGDVGKWSDGSLWIALGPFEPYATMDGWGSFPVTSPMESDGRIARKRSCRIEGTLTTTAQLIHRITGA